MSEGEGEEKMVLSHEPVPGYRKVFHLVVLASALYLAIVFLKPFL